MTKTHDGDVTSDPLFQPLQIKHLTLKNRIMSTSHASGMDDQGMPAERYQRYHEEKAKGGLALTMFGGSSNVAPDSPSVFGQLNVSDDCVIPHFQKFSECIHQHGAALMCQITHLGRRGDARVQDWLPMVAPSPIRETLHRNIPREIDDHDIQRIVKAFGQAARRCYEGGLDGLETMSSGHLIGQFFAPDTNQRTDKYGGSVENRVRFALMVHDEIRRCVGDDFLVGMRMTIEEDGGGTSVDDALEIARILEREGAVDFFNCNFGRMDTELVLAEKCMPGMTQPLAPFLDNVAAFKKEVSLPVFHAARITDVANARHAVKAGILDMVAMTRAHIADPQIANKIRRGEEDRIRPCFGASHCMDKRPSCIHNVASGRETMLPQVIEPSVTPGKRVVVVGGGPAGLEAARVAAERGHKVTVFEAAPKLGGQVLLAARASWRRDLISVVDWRVAELGHLGVDIRLNTYAGADDVTALEPDVVIVATGGLPSLDDLDGGELCITTWDVLSGEVAAADNILIYDATGRHDAPSCADHLAAAGATVTLIGIDTHVGIEMGYAESVVHRKQLYKRGVTTVHEQMIRKISSRDNRLVVEFENVLTGDRREFETEQVLVERATRALDDLFHQMRGNSINDGVTDIDALLATKPQPQTRPPSRQEGASGYTLYRVGDAVASRSLHAALLDAFRIAVTL